MMKKTTTKSKTALFQNVLFYMSFQYRFFFTLFIKCTLGFFTSIIFIQYFCS